MTMRLGRIAALMLCAARALGSDLAVDLGKATPPTGNKLNGPVHIRLVRANKLLNSYHIAIDNQNWQAPPSVTISGLLGQVPSFSASGLTTQAPPGTVVSHSSSRALASNPAGLTLGENAVALITDAQTLVTKAQLASDTLGQAISVTQQLFQRSSNDLSVSRETLVNDIHSTLADPSLTAYSSNPWPDVVQVDQTKAALALAKQAGGLPADVSSKVDEAMTSLQQISLGAALQANFSASAAAFNSAVNLMRSVAPSNCKFADDRSRQAGDTVCESFELSEDVPCHSVFGGNDSKLTLQVAQTVAFPAPSAQSQSQAQSIDLGTMTCSPPVTFSAGVAFSSIREQEFGIAAAPTGKGATTNQFVLTSDSRFKPIPMAFVHARLWESQEGAYGCHFTFGIGANIRGQNSGGSNAEYLVGGSLSLWHIAYITSGVHLGSQVTLADGYTLGSAVPSIVTEPPLKTGRAEGFGFSISFGTSPK